MSKNIFSAGPDLSFSEGKLTAVFSNAAWVKDKTWHPSQETKLLKDGRLKMRLKIADNEELVGWILSFGGEVKVVQPEALRAKIRDEAKRIFGAKD